MILRWLASKTVREAMTAHKHYRRLLAAQRDLLSPPAIAAIKVALKEVKEAINGGQNKGVIRIKVEELQFAAEKFLKPYPHAAWRENIEVFLVALAVAMAIRTFFLQPFKIPTGSMQPTLFGVTSVPDFSQSTIDFWKPDSEIRAEAMQQVRLRDALQIPTGWDRVKAWLRGDSYIHVVAHSTGTVQIEKPVKLLIFNLLQVIKIGGHSQIMWFPPDYGGDGESLMRRAGLDPNHVFQPGDDVIKMQVSAGDHLFVDRLTYNFRKPERGEIIVFETAGIPEDMREKYRIEANQFYIKRLVGLPGEKIQIGDDRHLVINGHRLDVNTPHFAKVYGFIPTTPPEKSQYSGHVNGTVAKEFDLFPTIAPLFPDAQTAYDIDGDAYMVMGDNTCDSLDSRSWGSFPAKYVIGKSFFVYWPITARFGTEANY